MSSYDVVVVGAGLAGLEVARSLAVAQKKVLLVDAKASLAERVHTTGIFVRRTLEDFHFPEHCLGPVVRDVSLYSPQGRCIDLQSQHDEFRVGKMGVLYEHWLEQCRALGVDVLLKTRFLSCELGQLSNKVKLQSEGREHEVITKFVIGCDGAQSRVAKSLKLSENQKWIVGLERVYKSGASKCASPKFHCLIDPVLAPGYIAWVVDDGDEVHVGVGGDAKRFDPMSALSEFESWAKHTIEMNTGDLIEQRGGRIPVGGLLRNISNPHGLLVGDAAGAVSPLTAGGLDPCLRMSRLAAILTIEYLNTNDERVLLQYNGQQIRKRFRKRLLLRRCLETIRSRTLINIGWSALNSVPGRAFAKKVMFGRGSFPDLNPETHDSMGARIAHVGQRQLQ